MTIASKKNVLTKGGPTPHPGIFVTGASGFLDSHLILQLLKAGYPVCGLVRTGARGDHVRDVMQAHGAGTARLEFVERDLTRDDDRAGAGRAKYSSGMCGCARRGGNPYRGHDRWM
ncbi:MAG TPA: NAD-dependent epimerase/dehydratase family protein [Aliiroseovarius sp.]|nr:NAD-dependent epimerase/dehydratase family protein [Aliiroseovarius sp.]